MTGSSHSMGLSRSVYQAGLKFLGTTRGWIVIVFILLVLWKCYTITRLIKLHEWEIYRWWCINDGSAPGRLPKLPRSAEMILSHPDYISHPFHPTVGLGNLLFIYSAVYAIAQQNDYLPAIKFTPKLHNVFQLNHSFIRDFDVSACQNLLFGRDECCIYDPTSQYLSALHPGRNVTLYGYLQSWRYFHPQFQEDLLREFTFKPSVLAQARIARNLAIRNAIKDRPSSLVRNRTIVGVHVRRGDILYPERIKFGHTTADANYYANAEKYLQENGVRNAVFIVCTNDVEWAKSNLPFQTMGFVENSAPEVDLAILSQSDHLILSVGTYSFFAGYLSKAKTVIYYKDWPKAGSEFAATTNVDEFWLPEWVALS